MKTHLLFLLSLALLLWGCSKEETPEPEPEPVQAPVPVPVYVLLETSVSNSSKGLDKVWYTSKYTYNEQQQLVSINMDSAGSTFRTYKLTYNPKNQLEQTVDGNERTVNAYDEQGRLVKQTKGVKGVIGLYDNREHFTFSYNNENQLTEARRFIHRNNEIRLTDIYKYTYTNGNPTTIEQVMIWFGSEDNQERVMLANLTYDDQKSSNKELPFTYFYPITDAPARNNLKSFTLSQHWEGYGNYTYDYTYNAGGYVATATRTHATGHQFRVTYTYGYR